MWDGARGEASGRNNQGPFFHCSSDASPKGDQTSDLRSKLNPPNFCLQRLFPQIKPWPWSQQAIFSITEAAKIFSRERSYIPSQPALLSRWFSGVPVCWDMDEPFPRFVSFHGISKKNWCTISTLPFLFWLARKLVNHFSLMLPRQIAYKRFHMGFLRKVAPKKNVQYPVSP